MQLAEVQRRRGKYRAAEDNLMEAAELYLSLGDEYALRIATVQNNLGLLYQEVERYAAAARGWTLDGVVEESAEQAS